MARPMLHKYIARDWYGGSGTNIYVVSSRDLKAYEGAVALLHTILSAKNVNEIVDSNLFNYSESNSL